MLLRLFLCETKAGAVLPACGLALLLLVQGSAAAACDPLLADQRADLEQTVQIHGGERVKNAFRSSTQRELIALASEKGVDVTLEIRNAAGGLVASADSPIQRSGIQRLVFTARKDTPYSVEVVGKEHAGVSGTVEVQVLAIAAVPDISCVDAHRILAAADTAYAVGQAVTWGTAAGAAADAPRTYASAADAYKAAAARLEASGPSVLLAQAQHAAAAVLYQDLYDWTQSDLWADKAAATYASMDDEYGDARAQALSATALMEMAVSLGPQTPGADVSGQSSEMLARARATLAALATFHAQRGELFDQALAQNNIGLAFYYESRDDEAIQAYERTLPIYRQLGEKPRQAQVLTNIGLAEYELGRVSNAVPRYAEALGLITPSASPALFATALESSALAKWDSGDLDGALREYGQALQLYQSIQDLREQALCLHGIGSVYEAAGDQELALNFYRQALAIRTPSLDGRGRVHSLRAIGNVLRSQGHPDEALKMHQEALSLATSPYARDGILIQIAKDYEALGQTAQALGQLRTLLAHAAPGDEVVRARALLERGRVRISTKDFAAGEADLRAALKSLHANDLPTYEFEGWVALARSQRLRGDVGQALTSVDRALALAEEVRLHSANPELRATLLQPLRPAFDLKISLLAERYFKGNSQDQRPAMRALMTAEQARARALADFQNLDVTAPGVDPRLVEQRRAIYKELTPRRAQLEARLDYSGATDPLVNPLRSEISALRAQLDQIDAQIAAASPAAAGTLLRAGAPLSIDLSAITADAALIEYWVGEGESFAWVATRQGLSMTNLGPSPKVVEAARNFHAALRKFASVPEAKRVDLAERLYALVMQPLDPRTLLKRTLIFAPDSALHYVPFAVLRSAAGGGEFLVEHHDIGTTPSLGMFLRGSARGESRSARKEMLLVADPVYDLNDSRLADVVTGKTKNVQASNEPPFILRGTLDARPLSRLPGTGQEASTIAALLPREEVVRLEGFAANRDRFLGAGLDRYRFIHVASHAVADSEIPQLSALILSTRDPQGQAIDGRVLAADLINSQIHAETVVLSACDTALGKNIAGEGLVGLRYVMLARGAKSVTSSLWPVPDQATAQLMASFYTSLLRRQSSAVVALSDAMRAMRASKFPDPGLWGAFVATVGEGAR